MSPRRNEPMLRRVGSDDQISPRRQSASDAMRRFFFAGVSRATTSLRRPGRRSVSALYASVSCTYRTGTEVGEVPLAAGVQ